MPSRCMLTVRQHSSRMHGAALCHNTPGRPEGHVRLPCLSASCNAIVALVAGMAWQTDGQQP